MIPLQNFNNKLRSYIIYFSEQKNPFLYQLLIFLNKTKILLFDKYRDTPHVEKMQLI